MSAVSQPSEQSVTLTQNPDIFYWWPIWLVAFALAGLGAWRGDRLVVVPPGAKVEAGSAGKLEIEPTGEGPDRPRVIVVGGVPRSATTAYLTGLVLVIFLTAAPLGKTGELILLALIGLMYLGVFVLVEYRPGVVDGLDVLREIPLYMSVGTFLFLGCTVFPLWLLFVMILPRDQVIFTPTRLIIKQGFGEIVQPYTPGAIRLKVNQGDMKQSILGMGSGNVIVTLTGPEPRIFEFRGILFVRAKIAQVERMLGMSATV